MPSLSERNRIGIAESELSLAHLAALSGHPQPIELDVAQHVHGSVCVCDVCVCLSVCASDTFRSARKVI